MPVNYDTLLRNLVENRDTPSMHCDGKCDLQTNGQRIKGVIKIRLRASGFNLRKSQYTFISNINGFGSW